MVVKAAKPVLTVVQGLLIQVAAAVEQVTLPIQEAVVDLVLLLFAIQTHSMPWPAQRVHQPLQSLVDIEFINLPVLVQ